MTSFILLGTLVALAPQSSPPAAVSAPDTIELAQLSFRSRIVVRVQTSQMTMLPAAVALQEKKGPKCIAMGDILAAAVLARSSVDLVLRGGYRVRARFAASCPALDYYSGFYVVPSQDGQLCARRDVVRDRAGGECEIDKFRKLVAQR